MSFPELESKIRKSCDKELEKLRKEGEQRLAMISADINAEAQLEKEKIISEGERDALKQSDSILSHARIEAKDIIETAKRKAVDSVYKALAEKIKSLPPNEKRLLCAKLYAIAREGISKPRVFVDPSCARYIKGVKKDLGGFGFIVEDAGGTMKVDAGLDAIVANIKTCTEPKVASILFGK
ncbi:MAG: V-type ATP synthase subunit E [Candidatus Altiarchaeota archaeon]